MKKIVIKGDMEQITLDSLVCRMSMADNENLVLGKRIDIPAELIRDAVAPDEFDREKHEIVGTYSFTVEVREKE